MNARSRLDWLFVAGAFAWLYRVMLGQVWRLADLVSWNTVLEYGILLGVTCALVFALMRSALRSGAPRYVWLGAVIAAAAALLSVMVVYLAMLPLLTAFGNYGLPTPAPLRLLSDVGFLLMYAVRDAAIVLTAYVGSRSLLRETAPPPLAAPTKKMVTGSWAIVISTTAFLLVGIVIIRWFGAGI